MTSHIPALRAFAGTDRGLVREENEDSILLAVPEDAATLAGKGVLAAVADGVGGAACGKMASSIAVQVLQEQYYRSTAPDPAAELLAALQTANTSIFRQGLEEPSCRGMATTCTVLVLKGYRGVFAHAGDSRAYLYRRGILQQITQDHTLVSRLVAEGLLSKEAAGNHPQRNIITKCLGNSQVLDPDLYLVSFQDDDIILLCSDGLYDMVPAAEIAGKLSDNDLQKAGEALIARANECGGSDNISVVLIRLSNAEPQSFASTRTYEPIRPERSRIFWICTALIFLLFVLSYVLMHAK